VSIRRLLFTESSPNLGGQELQALQQMTALLRRGVAVRLACRPGSRIHDGARALGLDALTLPMRMSLHPPSIVALRRLIADWRPDAVISHSGHDANNIAVAARLVRNRPRLIRMRTYLAGPARAWHSNLLSDLTLTCSAALRAALLANPRITPERIRVLHPGLPLDRLAADAQAPLPARLEAWLEKRSGPVLLHAAMLRPEKGHALMLSALPELLKKHPNLRYVIAGEGELQEQLAASIKAMKLSGQVFMAGMVSPLAPLYRRADLLVMPSSYEPFGMSQCEALSLGLPVVASRTGGIPETVQHQSTGLLVEPGDRLAWVATLNWALDHGADMTRMAEAGRLFVEKNFSIEANVTHLLDYIGSLL